MMTLEAGEQQHSFSRASRAFGGSDWQPSQEQMLGLTSSDNTFGAEGGCGFLQAPRGTAFRSRTVTVSAFDWGEGGR